MGGTPTRPQRGVCSAQNIEIRLGIFVACLYEPSIGPLVYLLVINHGWLENPYRHGGVDRKITEGSFFQHAMFEADDLQSRYSRYRVVVVVSKP